MNQLLLMICLLGGLLVFILVLSVRIYLIAHQAHKSRCCTKRHHLLQ